MAAPRKRKKPVAPEVPVADPAVVVDEIEPPVSARETAPFGPLPGQGEYGSVVLAMMEKKRAQKRGRR